MNAESTRSGPRHEPIQPPPEEYLRGRAGEREQELVGRLRAGDEQAREDLVRTFGSRVLALARRLLVREEDARELVREAFLQVFQGIGKFRCDSSLASWLEQILRDAAHRRLRLDSNGPETPLEDLLPRFDMEGHQIAPVSHWPIPENSPLEPAIRGQVRAAIESLPACHRAVLTLRDLEELSADQVARILSLSPAVVNQRLHRARQALRTRLDHLFSSS